MAQGEGLPSTPRNSAKALARLKPCGPAARQQARFAEAHELDDANVCLTCLEPAVRYIVPFRTE